MSNIIDDLQNTIDELLIKNKELESENEVLKSRITDYEMEYVKLEKENAELKEAIRVHECSHFDEPLIHDKKLWSAIKEHGDDQN